MNHLDFIYLNIPRWLNHGTERERKYAATHNATEIKFLKEARLLRPDSSVWQTPYEQTVVRLSDLTEEGQDFLMSAAISNWLGACDRKSNDMLKKGATEEQRLAIYADPKGLYSRLEKFRKTRLAKSQ